MDLEFHQLELRYEGLRSRSATRERRLLASLSELGQQAPVVVVAAGDGGRYVLVDGYKRVRALRRLHQDTVRATCWALDEMEALLLERLMHSADGTSALEQGWLLRELRDRFGLGVEELGRRFDKSPSWVSRRLGLVSALPSEIQEAVRQGQIVAHAAMKYLLPLARANRADCVELAAKLGSVHASTRQVGDLYAAYLGGDAQTRARLVEDPVLFLRAQEEARRVDAVVDASPARTLLGDLDALGGIARRLSRRVAQGLVRRLSHDERDQVQRALLQARTDVDHLGNRLQQELSDAGSGHAHGDPQAA